MSRRYEVRHGDVGHVVDDRRRRRVSHRRADLARRAARRRPRVSSPATTAGETVVALAGTAAAPWVFVAGQAWPLEVALEGARRSRRCRRRGHDRADAGDGGRRSSRRPATRVTTGDPVVVLEAMKMELPIRAPRDGVVAAVHCQRGRAGPAGHPAGGAGAVSSAPPRVTIVEVGPRDGLQNEPAAIATADKVALRRRVEPGRSSPHRGLGVRLAEVGAADGRRRRGLRRHRPRARRPLHRAGAEPGRPGPRARRAASTASRSSPPPANVQPAQHQPVDRRIAGPLCRGRGRGPGRTACRVRGYLSTAFGCPFEGAVAAGRGDPGDQARCSTWASTRWRSATRSASAHPGQVRTLLDAVDRRVPLARLALHFHDTRGTALANVLAGLDAGVATFDARPAASAAAPTRRAPPATSPPRICSTCSTAWASRPASRWPG